MENEKKNNGTLVGILIGIIIMLLVGVCLYATGTISFKQTTSTDNGRASENNKNIKIDDSKDYVYDADYKYDNKYTEFDRTNGEGKGYTIDYYGITIQVLGKEYLNNLKVPYININSTDAQIANNELKNLYLKSVKDFDSYAEENEKQTGPSCSQILTYRNYNYNNILSVVVIDSVACTSPFVFNYHVFNFDLSTGNKISYDEMLSKLGYNKDLILEKMQASIKTRMDETNIGTNREIDLSKECHYSNENSKYGTTNCYDITYKLLEESINNNSLLYFSDNDGFLNILPIFYYNFAQNGDRNHYLVKVAK